MEWVARIGIDWADQKHDWVLKDGSERRAGGVFLARPEAVHEWVRTVRARYPNGKILVSIEQSRGALIYALMQYDFLILAPINPRALALHRESLNLSGAKSDPKDADLICDFGANNFEKLRVLTADDPQTRKLGLMAEARRGLVDQRTGNVQALIAACKQYFPQVLEWFGGAGEQLTLAFLQTWPTLELARTIRRDRLRTFMREHSRWSNEKIDALYNSIRSAVALTPDEAITDSYAMLAQCLASLILALNEQVSSYDKRLDELSQSHPDYEVFASFPGAGKVMTARLIPAFGKDRDRWQDAREIQSYSGIAPVVESSGKHRWVHARWHCPKFLRQTFHEFALASIPHSEWAKAFYHQQRDRGAGHHAAVRSLAYRWMRILFRCWKNSETYDEALFLTQLRLRKSPIMKRLAA